VVALLPLLVVFGGEPRVDPVGVRLSRIWSWALMAVTLGPAAEEIVFRSLLFRALIDRCRFAAPVAAGVSTAAFVATHLPWESGNPVGWVVVRCLELALFSLLACWLFHRSGWNLWGAVVLHAGSNFIVFFFTVKDPSRLGLKLAGFALGWLLLAGIYRLQVGVAHPRAADAGPGSSNPPGAGRRSPPAGGEPGGPG